MLEVHPEDGELVESEGDDVGDPPATSVLRTATGETIDKLLVAPETRSRILRFYAQGSTKGSCSHPDCSYLFTNEGSAFRHVEQHNSSIHVPMRLLFVGKGQYCPTYM